MSVRLDDLQLDIETKVAAIKAFTDAISKASAAFDAAVQDLDHPNPNEIYDSVRDFAAQAKDAHDKCKTAFATP